MGLFDNLIEPEEDPVNKDVNNEGNIPQQDSENEDSQNKNNIQPEESKPETPMTEGNIQPEEAQPDGPEATGNIQPEEAQPESPTAEGNIQPEQSQPESPTKEGNIDPQETDTEQTERESIPVSENAPDSPQRSGNIQPSEFDPEDQPESNISPDEDKPVDAPQRRRNIRPDEENRPDNPNRIPFQSKEDAKPEEPSGSQIETEESKPSNPQKRGNIKPTEEPPSTEPMDESDLEVSATGQENVGSEGNIKPQEENAPASPNREENISPDPENRPLGPQFSGNIEPDEENKPESPNTQGSISPDEESKPSSPSTEGNVTPTEESEPISPNRQENISPDEESSPSSPSTEGNIKSEESQPSGPGQTGNIVPNEDATPESPSRVGNISPREQNTPAAPNRSGSIDPAENQPDSPSREENIKADKKKPKSPRIEDNIDEEDRRPEAPQLEQNINPTDGENTDGIAGEALEQPRREGNIDPSDKSVTDQTGTDPLQQPQRKGNIDPQDETTTDEIAGQEIDREQPLKFQPKNYASQIDPKTAKFTDDVAAEFIGSTDGVGEWQVPLRHQPSDLYANQINPQSEQFRDGLGSEFIGETDGPEWEVPLRHQSQRYADQINPEDASVTNGIGGNEPGGVLQNQPFRQTDVDGDAQSPKQNQYQPKGLEASPYLGQEYTDTDGNAIFTGSDDGAAEWKVPLRYQPSDYLNQIDPKSQGFRDGIGKVFTGEGDGSAEWEVPLRYQPTRFSNQISPDHEGGLYSSQNFVAGSNEPGDNVRDMGYSFDGANAPLRFQPAEIVSKLRGGTIINPDDEGGRYQLEQFVAGSNEPEENIRNMDYDSSGTTQKLRFQTAVNFALSNGIIDPSFEGGQYLSPKFVAGSNEPGQNIRNMDYDVEGVTAKLRHQTAVNNALVNGTIDPSFEGGSYSVPNFVAGSNEPGDNVRDMTYNKGGAVEDLRHQPPEIAAKLRDSTIINPDDEGGRYQLKKFVTGSDEPGDDIRDMKYDKSGAAQDLRHQPPEIIAKLRDSTIINPDDEGGRYQLEKFVAGSDEPGGDIRDMAYGFEGSSEALRHQTAVKFALNNNVIDPSFEGGRYLDEKFVTGSDEPGDDIRDMKYDVEGVSRSPRHVKKFYKFALENYIIDPSFEGGAYLSPKFVAGSNEPGDNVRDMKYTVEGSVAKLRHQTAVKNALTNGIIDPSFEGGNYLIPKFVAGSNEPGDNVRDMAYTVSGATGDLRFQPDEITSKLRSSTIIDPSDDGGRYQLQEFVVGIDEPGDQLPEFQPAPFNAESSHSSQNNGPVLNPAFDTGQQKKDEIETQNQRVSELDRNASPDSDGAIQFQPFRQTDISQDPQAPKQNRYQPVGFEASPFLPEFTDGIGGSFPDSENAVIEANEPRTSQTRFTGSIEELNRTVRLREFNEKFEDGKNNFSLFDSPATLQGNAGAAAEPFILRRPESGGGSPAIANVKQSDSRIAPTGSAAEDTVRMSKFFSTAKGLVYNVKQQFLQTQNPRKRTKLYDPTAPVQTAGSGMAIRPGQEITRHLGADSGPAGIVGDAAEAIGSAVGFDVPKSSRYEDEIQEEARQTEWGEMSGSLFWLSPVATSGLPDVSGSEAQNVVAQTRSENVRNIKQLFSTEENEQLSKFAASSLASRGGIGNGYLFTNTYDPQGGPNSNGTVRTDNYHPSSPYLANAETTGSRFDANSSSYNGPDFNENYIKLSEKSNSDRDNKGSYFPYTNPDGSPAQDSVVDGDGNVQAQIQNDNTSEVYFENRTFRSRTPVHRGVPNQEKSRGIPNYSLQNEDGQKEKRIDWINRLEPIVGKDADPDKEAYGRDGRHEDFIPFKFYDIPNEGSLVFRAFLEGISDNLSPEWSQTDYAGRPEQGHKYGGYSNTISFSFQLVPFSREEFKALWKKVNYLKGLTTPASYSKPEGGGGGYMTPPFMRLTIGDMFNDVYGYMNSLTISVNDDVPYEIDKDLGRLPRGLEIDVDWQVIPKRAPLALQKYYDAPFLEEVDNPIRESPDPRPPVELPTSDAESSEYSPRDRNGTDTGRANELSSAPPEGTDGIDNTPSPEDITDNIPNNPL